ncbi:hypothetical protein ACVWWG_001917 [Bradyrhizobium sp. LB7.2]
MRTNSLGMATIAKHPHTKIKLISSLASRQGGVTQAELREATGWKLVPMPLIAKRCKMKLITKRTKGNVTRNNGKIASKSDHSSSRSDYRHSRQKAFAMHKRSDAENAS